MPEYFIGIDSGTQSTKAIIIDGLTGGVVAKCTYSHDMIEDLPPGHKEQHPADWIRAVDETIAGAIKESGVDPKEIKGIGVSGQQHGFVPLDADNNVIRPAKLWCDTSTTDQCVRLTEQLGGLPEVIGLIGNSIPPGFTASKILWMKEAEPENFQRLATVLLPHDYINFYLTGNKVMEFGDASGTALLEVRSRTWSKPLLRAIDEHLEAKLPPLQHPDKIAGAVRGEIAAKFGFGDDVIVSSGGGDNMMGAIGTGNTRGGIVTASLGTSGTIYAYSDHPVVDPRGEIAAFCDSTGGWLPLLCTMNVTVATELVKDAFGFSNKDLARAVMQVPPGSDGLILVPYFEGERTPNVPDGTGVYFGVSERTFTKAHYARAAMEGATLGMNYGLNRMRKLGITPAEIRATGGGAKNDAWRQIIADVFGAEVVCMENEEGAAFGATLQAKWAYGLLRGDGAGIQDITDRFVKVKESTRTAPMPRNVKVYEQLQKVHDAVGAGLMEAFALHRKFVTTIHDRI